jgi:hypothetical protein
MRLRAEALILRFFLGSAAATGALFAVALSFAETLFLGKALLYVLIRAMERPGKIGGCVADMLGCGFRTPISCPQVPANSGSQQNKTGRFCSLQHIPSDSFQALTGSAGN